MPFGLEDLITLYRAELADGAVHRAHPIGLGQWARTGFERTGEKLVEAGVAGRIGVGRLGHVDVVLADEPGDQLRGEIAPLP